MKTLIIRLIRSHLARILKKVMSSLEKIKYAGKMVNYEIIRTLKLGEEIIQWVGKHAFLFQSPIPHCFRSFQGERVTHRNKLPIVPEHCTLWLKFYKENMRIKERSK